jgi:hypothetical protein
MGEGAGRLCRPVPSQRSCRSWHRPSRARHDSHLKVRGSRRAHRIVRGPVPAPSRRSRQTAENPPRISRCRHANNAKTGAEPKGWCLDLSGLECPPPLPEAGRLEPGVLSGETARRHVAPGRRERQAEALRLRRPKPQAGGAPPFPASLHGDDTAGSALTNASCCSGVSFTTVGMPSRGASGFDHLASPLVSRAWTFACGVADDHRPVAGGRS